MPVVKVGIGHGWRGRGRSQQGCFTLAASQGSGHVVVSAGRTKHENLRRANRIASGCAQHLGRETGEGLICLGMSSSGEPFPAPRKRRAAEGGCFKTNPPTNSPS